jgi:SM-20-related protein
MIASLNLLVVGLLLAVLSDNADAFTPISFSHVQSSPKSLPKSSLTLSSQALPRISSNDLEILQSKGYLILENFIPDNLQEALRQDVQNLRQKDAFKIAKIGQDSTNTLNTEIRVAETCFLGPSKLSDIPDESRSKLYDVLDQLRQDLPQPLDASLSEFLYAYYPTGGFYRRHRDAIPGSASVLRKFSLLMYLNKGWKEEDGGKLRVHMDSGGDFLPEGEQPDFLDVDPKGGTLVLFDSDKFPHEVLDTQSERVAIVGWYNRPVTASDISEISGGEIDPTRLIALAVAAGLVTVGLVSVLSG